MKKHIVLSVLISLCSLHVTAQTPADTTDNYSYDLVITQDSTFYYASLVNDYFMRICPDPTTDSYVGGKKRNSRIWTRGVYYEGLMAMYRQRPVTAWYEYTSEWGDFHEWVSNDTKAPSNADFHCCGMAYLDMYMLDTTKSIRKTHIKEHIDYLMYERKTINDWSWIDAVHMAMPIYAQLGVIENDTAYYEYMYNMYMYTRDKHGTAGLLNPDDGLWWRDSSFDPPYTDKVETDKPCYWSRGNGWVYTALARVLYYAPDTVCHREQYEADFKLMSEALIKCQRADGFWSVSLAAPTNYGSTESAGPETSGTALFVAGMAYGVHTGLLDSATYMPHVVRGWNALCHKAVGDDGFLGYVQGTGSKPEDSQPVVFSTIPNFEDFGIGCFLLAAAEVYQLGNVDLNGLYELPEIPADTIPTPEPEPEPSPLPAPTRGIAFLYDSGYSDYSPDKDPFYALLDTFGLDITTIDIDINGNPAADSLSQYRLVVASEAMSGNKSYTNGLVDIVGTVPYLSFKAFNYTSGRWSWATPVNPDKGTTVIIPTEVGLRHKIFDKITPSSEGEVEIFATSDSKYNMVQAWKNATSSISGDTLLATTIDGLHTVHLHYTDDSATNGYILLPLSSDPIANGVGEITDDARQLFTNAVAYLLGVENPCDFRSVDALSTTGSDKVLICTEYYNLSGIRVAAPTTGLYIEKRIYSDGSVEIVKRLQTFSK
ncbi:MAG: glycoside hydrolase family 88 protein [Coprobacter sp.]|nr:glycoside hydrolase family 88 protein [Coprobacter sp.]